MTGTDPDLSARARIWDLPIRIFHWAIVCLLPFSWWTAKNGLFDAHRLSGYTILGLLVFRLIWGFTGGETARFANFVGAPKAVWLYVRALRKRGGPKEAVGHNPLGSWSVVALLAAMIGQVALGLIAVDEDGIESGPLSHLVSFDTARLAAETHATFFYILAGLVALHVAAIATHFLLWGKNLVGPMITGRGPIAPGALEPRRAGPGAFFAALLVSATLAWFVSKGLKL